MTQVHAVREALVAISRRYSRVAHEAEDLAHDIILSALQRGLPIDGESFARTAHGAARRHGAFLARTAGRRRARELRVGAEHADFGVTTASALSNFESIPLAGLSPVLRTTLLLLLLGLGKAELRVALGVSDGALRKRFQALRKQGLSRPDMTIPPRTPTLSRLRASQVTLLPRLPGRAEGDRTVATADPDGHGLIFAQVLTTSSLTATPPASRSNQRMRLSGGTSCSIPNSRTSPSSSS